MKKLAITITIAALSMLWPLVFLAANNGNWGAFWTGYGIEALAAMYWTPTIIGIARHKHIPNVGGVIIVNALLGWTVIGWIIALVMAVKSKPQPVVFAPAYYPARENGQ
jgi:hypothetical protein